MCCDDSLQPSNSFYHQLCSVAVCFGVYCVICSENRSNTHPAQRSMIRRNCRAKWSVFSINSKRKTQRSRSSNSIFWYSLSFLFLSYLAGSQQSIRSGANFQSNPRRPGRRSLAANRGAANRLGITATRHASGRRATAAARRLDPTRRSGEAKPGAAIAHIGIGVGAIKRAVEAIKRRDGARARGRNHPEKRRRRADGGRKAANSRMHGGICAKRMRNRSVNGN